MKKPKPLASEPRIATMLFVDFVGSSEAASLKKQKEYGKLISSFQNTIKRVFEVELQREETEDIDEGIKYSDVRGDEGFLIIVSKYGLRAGTNKKADERLWENRKNLLKVLRIALKIKYEWLFEKENMDRLAELKKPFEVAIGINTGNVMLKKEDKLWKAEGYAINLAKRIESQSRYGEYSGIFISEYSFGYYNDIPGENTLRFRQNEKVSFKGISGTVRTYELIFAMLDEEDEILNIPETILYPKMGDLKKIEGNLMIH